MSAVRSLCVLSARHNTYLAHTVSRSRPYLRHGPMVVIKAPRWRRADGGDAMTDPGFEPNDTPPPAPPPPVARRRRLRTDRTRRDRRRRGARRRSRSRPRGLVDQHSDRGGFGPHGLDVDRVRVGLDGVGVRVWLKVRLDVDRVGLHVDRLGLDFYGTRARRMSPPSRPRSTPAGRHRHHARLQRRGGRGHGHRPHLERRDPDQQPRDRRRDHHQRDGRRQRQDLHRLRRRLRHHQGCGGPPAPRRLGTARRPASAPPDRLGRRDRRRHRQRRRHRRHAQRRRRDGDRPQPVDHGQRRGRRQLASSSAG